MTEDEHLALLLRSAVPPTSDDLPAQDVWPTIARGRRAPARWSWLDVGVATGAGLAMTLFPGWLWVLAYHL